MASAPTDIRYLKGVGERRAALYKKLGITTAEELLYLFPRTYLDLSSPYSIVDAPADEAVAIRARVVRKSGEQRVRKGMSLFKVDVEDDTAACRITFFNQKYTVDALKTGEEYIFYGRLQKDFLRCEMTSPLVISPTQGTGLLPVYPLTAGLSSKIISQNVKQALGLLLPGITETLPPALRAELKLCALPYALGTIHSPPSQREAQVARDRLIFEELFTLSVALSQIKQGRAQAEGIAIGGDSREFIAALPFTPTGAQLRALSDITADLASGRPMTRLLQGDVGSGKTMVAAGAMFLTVRGGLQAAMMAPTEILAEQHYETLTGMLAPFGIKVALLTGSVRAREKKAVLQSLADGSTHVIVGTHALLSHGTQFARLGLVVTDEQHRFGVNQRVTLTHKGEAPHTLVMSATPIPRTLALIIYGDLDVSVIDEMPAGRRPVRTYHIDSAKRERAFGFIRDHLDAGRQAYIVCPLVEQGEADPGLIPATEYSALLADGPFAGYSVGLLHGRMKAADKEKTMRAFKGGHIQLLVSTTVVEVGVDVPNAAIMLIENAERFGLSQLHQLRGRVGRSGEQSHCILVSDAVGDDARRRLQVMCRTHSGFKISEEDLALRGPGDFFGERQHGLPQFRIADMASDTKQLALAQHAAARLLDIDPALAQPEHQGIKEAVESMLKNIGERPN